MRCSESALVDDFYRGGSKVRFDSPCIAVDEGITTTQGAGLWVAAVADRVWWVLPLVSRRVCASLPGRGSIAGKQHAKGGVVERSKCDPLSLRVGGG